MPKITLPKETMLEILEEEDLVRSDEIVDKRRWALTHELIFQHEDKLYRTHYSVGATENQDEGPWEYVKTVECTEVEEYDKIVKAYRAVECTSRHLMSSP